MTILEVAVGKVKPRIYDNTTLSTIIRFHKRERLPFLEEAVFSLAIQHYSDLETVIILQNGTEELKRAVEEIINHQPWPSTPRHQILSISIPQGGDGRSTLLNLGIKHAVGRYLAFLDDDDVVYQHGYEILIGQLVSGGRAMAIGGCRTARTRQEANCWYVSGKETSFPWGRSRLDLFQRNFVPIHSYVIDRSRISDFELYFDDAFPLLEDYDFLLRFFARFDPDFSKLDVPVCEYRIREDGSNSIPYSHNSPSQAIAAHQRAEQLIRRRKETLTCLVSANELAELRETELELARLRAEHEQLHYKVARRIKVLIDRYPWVKKRLAHLIVYGWNISQRLRGRASKYRAQIQSPL